MSGSWGAAAYRYLARATAKLSSVRRPCGDLLRDQILQRIIESTNSSSYLEIGVNTTNQPGYSRNLINGVTIHGVDVNPDSAAEFVMSSDVFFEEHPELTYDLIFVDGLHHWEQALRDIINSLSRLTDKGHIVVHDTRPSSWVSTTRAEGLDLYWHGDVWKAIVVLRTIFPDLGVTTVDSDHGLTIIYRKDSPVSSRYPQLTESLSGPKLRLTWHFYRENYRKFLNLTSDDEFKAMFPLSSLKQ